MSNPIAHAQMLETEGNLADAIQAYDAILMPFSETATRAHANFRLGTIYREWGELFAAQRFLAQAHQLAPENTRIRDAIAELNLYFSQNREQVADEMARKNSDQIVSLFRIATGIKLLAMDKPVQAYPLMKSRTKIFPNAAVAKHLLTDIQITESERNSAIDFLLERGWLVNTGPSLYTIAERGLYAFYTELANLHVVNDAYLEAVACYEQAYWLKPSQLHLRYEQVIWCACGEAWDTAVAYVVKLPTEVPDEVNAEAYHGAVALSYHHIYQTTQDESAKQKAMEACEAALRVNKKNKLISNLLLSYQDKKRWWRR